MDPTENIEQTPKKRGRKQIYETDEERLKAKKQQTVASYKKRYYAKKAYLQSLLEEQRAIIKLVQKVKLNIDQCEFILDIIKECELP
jgi:phosphopantetheine adenylyltransferase